MIAGEGGLREEICERALALLAHGLAGGPAGNLSARLADGYLVTPAGAGLGDLDPARLARLDLAGRRVSGGEPSEEAFLHLAVYEGRPAARGVIHLHSPHAVAVSCLADVDPADALPPLTADHVIRVGRLPLVPFHPPGDPRLLAAIRLLAAGHPAVLLANHGPLVAGASLHAAADAIEELEATARLSLLLRGHPVRALTPEQVALVRAAFPFA